MNKNIETIKEELSEIISDNPVLELLLVMKEEGQYYLKLADLDSEMTASELEDLYEKALIQTIITNDYLDIRPLSTADEQVNTLYLYDYKELPDEMELFTQFDINQINSIEKFNFKTDSLANLFGFLVYIGSMDKGVLLYKKHYPVALIKRDSFLLGIKKDAERFVKIDGGDILRVNADFQMIRLGNEIFIVDLKALERSFGFTQLIAEAAAESIKEIEKKGLIEDTEVLYDLLDDVSFCRKLSKVTKSSPVFKLGIPRNTIIDFSKNNIALHDKFKYSDDGQTIRLDTKKSKIAFLKLLNDEFLVSELTKQYYEASAKDVIEA